MHKKKKRKIFISFLVLLILIGFNGAIIVNGDTNTDQAGHGTLHSGTGCTVNPDKKSGPRYTTSNTSVGVRLALVDKNGNLIGKIVDIWNQDNFKQKSWPIYVVGGTQKLKKDVTKFTATDDTAYATDVYNLIEKWSGHFSWTSTIKSVDSMNEAFEPLMTKIDGASGFTGFASAIVSLSDRWENAKNDPEKIKKIEEGIKGLFGLASSYTIDYQNTFLQIEPLATYETYYCNFETGNESQQRLYYGTITELQQRQSVHGIASWGDKPWEGMYNILGVGIFINTSKAKDPENAKPTIYASETDNNPSFSAFNSNPTTNGWGISHVWLGILSSGSCEDLIKIIDENPGEYKLGEAKYEQAVNAILTGDKTVEIKSNDGKIYHVDKAYTFDFLKKENYSKAEHYNYRAVCENYHPVSCEVAVNYINKWGTGTNIPSLEYDEDIKEVSEGTFVYWASDTSQSKGPDGKYPQYYFKMDKQYPITQYKGLDKTNYGTGKASCKIDLDTITCPEALAYIHAHPTEFGAVGTLQYHDSITSIYNGTFTYSENVSDPDNPGGFIIKQTKIDRSYPEYDMLLKINYGDGPADCAKKPITTTCSEELKPILDDTCETGLNYYRDSINENYWLKCGNAYSVDGQPYSSENTGHEALSNPGGTPYATVDPAHVGSYEGIVGNAEYCKVYCYETVETNFPTKVTSVRSGQTFGWGINGGRDGIYGTIKIEKHCSNKKRTDPLGASGDGYLYKKWEDEYKANEKKLIDGYIRRGAAQEAKVLVALKSTSACCIPAVDGGYCDCDEHGCKWSDCCSSSGTIATAGSTATHTNPAEISHNWPGHTSQTVSPNQSSACYLDAGTAIAEAIKKAKDEAQSEADAAESKYAAAANREPKLLDQIRQCTNSIKYVYKTTINFNFEEPMNEAYTDPNTRYFKMDPVSDDSLLIREDAEDPTFTTKNVNTSTCTTKIVYSYDCSANRLASKCKAEVEKVLDCKQVTWDIKGEWTYKYPEEEFTWFSLKTDSSMMNLKEKKSMTEDEAFFYSIGFGLPTAWTLPTGKYEMAVAVSNIGDNGSLKIANPYNQPDGHFGPGLVINAATKKGFDYVCTYEVENDMFGYDCRYQNGVLVYDSPEYCDPTEDDNPNGKLIGIDIAYRLVGLLTDGDDISKAFPGKDGLGRNIGSNWSSFEGKDDLATILRADIYDQNRSGQKNLAMYEIFLDVGTIQKIRKDNESYGGNEYTSFDNVKCAGGNEKYCATDFISDLHAGKYGQQLYGTCLTKPGTQERAEDVLEKGCYGTYSFPEINWAR